MRWTCPKTLECCGFIFQSIHQYTLIAFARHFFSNTLNLADKSLTCLMRQGLFTFYEFWAESSIRVEAWVALTSLLIQMQSSSDVEDEERTNSEPHSFVRVGEFDQDWADLDVGCTDWHCLQHWHTRIRVQHIKRPSAPWSAQHPTWGQRHAVKAGPGPQAASVKDCS